MKMVLTLLFSLVILQAPAQLTTVAFQLYSKEVGDSFDITVSHTDQLKEGQYYSVVYYLDAQLKSGHKLRALLADSARQLRLSTVLFVGISGVENSHAIRRRDFLPPYFNQDSNKDQPLYGHADRFYTFLKKELIPYVEKTWPVTDKRTLIGHSFGGLFAFYCLFRNDSPFQQYAALSPSLWVNHEDIFQYEEAFHQKHDQLDATLYLSTGRAERFNHVRKTARRMHRLLLDNRYKGLHLIYAEHRGKMHNSQVPLSLEYVLDHLSL